jgi:hypothetical protein
VACGKGEGCSRGATGAGNAGCACTSTNSAVGVAIGSGAAWGEAAGTVTVTTGIPSGLGETLMATAVPVGKGVSSFSTKLSPPADSWVSPAASWPTTLASMVCPSLSTNASMVARASFTAAVAGSDAGCGSLPLNRATRVARSDMAAPCAAPG